MTLEWNQSEDTINVESGTVRIFKWHFYITLADEVDAIELKLNFSWLLDYSTIFLMLELKLFRIVCCDRHIRLSMTIHHRNRLCD